MFWMRESKIQSLKGMNRDIRKYAGLVNTLLPLYNLCIHWQCDFSKCDLWPVSANTYHTYGHWACELDANVYGKVITSMNNSRIIITVITIVIMDGCGQTRPEQFNILYIAQANPEAFPFMNCLTRAKNSFGSRFKWQEWDFIGLVYGMHGRTEP